MSWLSGKLDLKFEIGRDEVAQRTYFSLFYDNAEHTYVVGAESVTDLRTSPIFDFYIVSDFTDKYKQITTPKITRAIGGILVRQTSEF